jgi:glycine betaine transporter
MENSKSYGSVFWLSGSLLLLFVLVSFINVDFVTNMVNKGFGFSVKYFGAFWQVLLLGTFIIGLVLAFSKYGKVRLGGMDKQEISTFKWISMIMCTLLAGGGVFWAAAEPIYHFMSVPPLFGDVEAASVAATTPALAQSYLHWGFLAWAILGTLSVVVMMYGHYHRGMPLKPRTLFYPIFGEKIMKNSTLGTAIDVSCILAVAAGTIGPIGFLGLQASYGLETLFGIPNVYLTQLLIIVGLVTITTISTVTGIHKGIQLLSRFNVGLALVLLAGILLVGPGGFIIDNFLQSMGLHIEKFLSMSTFRGDEGWLGWWTVFFWGWFLGYGPMMAIFISRISRGRTIREIIMAVSIIAPVVTMFWFTVVGGSGIFYEISNPGSISSALNEFGLPAAMMALTSQLPMSLLFGSAFLILTIIFVATTGDSMSYTISMAVTGRANPPAYMRVFWSVLMGVVAAILVYVGEGGIGALQSFIVVTAVPVSIILLPMFWLAPKVANILAKEQGIVTDDTTFKESVEKVAG